MSKTFWFSSNIWRNTYVRISTGHGHTAGNARSAARSVHPWATGARRRCRPGPNFVSTRWMRTGCSRSGDHPDYGGGLDKQRRHWLFKQNIRTTTGELRVGSCGTPTIVPISGLSPEYPRRRTDMTSAPRPAAIMCRVLAWPDSGKAGQPSIKPSRR